MLFSLMLEPSSVRPLDTMLVHSVEIACSLAIPLGSTPGVGCLTGIRTYRRFAHPF